jgi:hypothetical protein
MTIRRRACCIAVVFSLFVAARVSSVAAADLPPFGKDTVLVWKNANQEDLGNIVVRIAQFLPDRYIEWENAVTQGTVLMSAKAVQEGKLFLNSRLFEAGRDMKGDGATTLWLSTWTYAQLKAKPKVKLSVDSVDAWMYPEGVETLPVEVNRVTTDIPVLKVRDDRGSTRWFIDSAENPLLVKHVIRTFSQTLVSISTDRPNTLRWIKGKKVPPPVKPQSTPGGPR